MKKIAICMSVILALALVSTVANMGPFSITAEALDWSLAPYRCSFTAPLDHPDAVSTSPQGIYGEKIVGYYTAYDGWRHGFLYDGTTWTTLDCPDPNVQTFLSGIHDDKIVGYCMDNSYRNHGFLYDGTTWTTLDHPDAVSTSPQGIYGNKIVGTCAVGGFLYDGTTWTTLDHPDAVPTAPQGIYGDRIVGYYNTYVPPIGRYGFLYDGTTWTTLAYPVRGYGVEATDIFEDKIVGTLTTIGMVLGFLYDGTTWTTMNYSSHPSLPITMARGIYGDKIVGTYGDSISPYQMHGFLVLQCTISNLRSLVSALADAGLMVQQAVPELLSRVDRADKFAEQDKICQAMEALGDVVRYVNAQRGKTISAEAANKIIADADSVIAYLLSQLPVGKTC